MKSIFLLILFLAVGASPLASQTADTLVAPPSSVAAADTTRLGEAVVQAARVVQQADRRVVYPTAAQIAHSTSGYALLRQLALPAITVDEKLRTVSHPQGRVVVKVNDVEVSEADLLALDLSTVRRVEHIDIPGVRYGEDVAAVVNIVTRAATGSLQVGASTWSVPDYLYEKGDAYLRYNWRRSTIGVDYGAGFSNACHADWRSETRYQLTDGSELLRTQQLQHTADRVNSHTARLRYTTALAERYTVQATLSTAYSRQPHSASESLITSGTETFASQSQSKDRLFSPTFDLYALWHVKPQQTLTFDASASYSRETFSSTTSQPSFDYAYHGDNRVRLFSTSLLYEWKLRPFTLSVGADYWQQYGNTDYVGSLATTSSVHSSYQRAFAQVVGKLWKLSYQVGAELQRNYYRVAGEHEDDLAFRPQFTLTYAPSQAWSVRYALTTFSKSLGLKYVSNVSVKQDEISSNAGNVSLKNDRCVQQQVDVTFQRPRFLNQLTAFLRVFDRPVMGYTYRDETDQFFATKHNGKSLKFFVLSDYVRADLVPDHLILTLVGNWEYFYNHGQDYLHSYNTLIGQTYVNAYLGRFTLSGGVDSGWRFMEGESKGINAPTWTLSADYRLPLHRGNELSVGIFAQNLFTANPQTDENFSLARLATSHLVRHSRDDGNYVAFTLTYKFTRGRHADDIDRSLQPHAIDTGVIK